MAPLQVPSWSPFNSPLDLVSLQVSLGLLVISLLVSIPFPSSSLVWFLTDRSDLVLRSGAGCPHSGSATHSDSTKRASAWELVGPFWTLLGVNLIEGSTRKGDFDQVPSETTRPTKKRQSAFAPFSGAARNGCRFVEVTLFGVVAKEAKGKPPLFLGPLL